MVTDPVAQSLLTRLRDKATPSGPVYYLNGLMLSGLLIRYVISPRPDLFPFSRQPVQTPLGQASGLVFNTERMVVVSVVRAGVVGTDAAQLMIPGVDVGFIDLHRDEKPPCECRVGRHTFLPERLDGRTVLLFDPMLATGKTIREAVTILKARGAAQVIVVSWIVCNEGMKVVLDAHPDVEIHAAAVDNLNPETLFLEPGLEDAGNRLFGPRPEDEEVIAAWLAARLVGASVTSDERMLASVRAGIWPQMVGVTEVLRPLVASGHVMGVHAEDGQGAN